MRSGTPPATARPISPGTPSAPSLAAIYAATLLFWLRDFSEDEAATLAFLDRRLAGIGRVAALRKRIERGCARFLPWREAA